MGLFSNRIRTITGENAKLWKSLSRLAYYAANKKRIGKLISNSLPFINSKPSYDQWLIQSQSISKDEILNEISEFSFKPILSVVIINNSSEDCQNTFASIKNQLYAPHEIFIIGEIKNTFVDVKQITISELFSKKVITEGFVLLLNAGDVLTEDGLFLIAKAFNESSNCKCIYFDEDKISNEGKRFSPNFKPGWSPDLFAKRNYIAHGCFHHSLFISHENIIPDALNITEKILQISSLERAEIVHIQRVLLSNTNLIKAFQEFDDKQAETISGEPLISIIIPTKNKSKLVEQCIQSIIEISSYKNFEIILVDNRSDEHALVAMIELFSNRKDLRFQVVRADIDFNFSTLINLGVEKSKGEFLVLLNNDVKVITTDWLEKMIHCVQQKHVGVVGAKLLYPDNTIQHAGIVLENENISKHIYLGKQATEVVEEDALNVTRNYLALTAACVMVSKQNFNAVGGFDPQFKVEFNDVDFCLKNYEKGLYNMFLPNVQLYHFESASRRHPHSDKRSYKQHLLEVSLMRKKWAKYLANDPYNTNRY